MDIAGKTVLFIAPKFFGYEGDIHDELVRRGATVDMLLDRPFNTPLMTALTRFARRLVVPFVDRLYFRQLADFKRADYDLIFVVNGQTLSSKVLAHLKARYPRAQFVLYMWDSVRNRASALGHLRWFDRVFTFDRQDSLNHPMQLRPLFFSKGFETADSEGASYEVSFIGTAHTDRARVVAAIDASLPTSAKRFWYLYLQAPWVFYLRKLISANFRSARKEQFRFTPLDKAEVQRVLAGSRVILDIEHPQQIGLTMRTLETFGAAKKLATTNAEIRLYEFYNPANICVLDRHAARIPAAFLSAPYEHPSAELYHKYSLAGWMDEILSQV
jgi:hypothetical protein